MENNSKSAVLYYSVRPNKEQEKSLLDFVKSKYGDDCALKLVSDISMKDGFRLVCGNDTYNWNKKSRYEQLKKRINEISASADGNIIPLIRESVENWVPSVYAEQVGTVISVGDGIATVSGLDEAFLGEILIFNGNVRGMVLSLSEDKLGCVLFDSDGVVGSGSSVMRTGKIAGMPCGEGFLGRCVDALGFPIDEKGKIEAKDYRPIESPAPEIKDRQSVNTPLETGILVIDSMFPIGRGQRELIIGDRQTGKTSIAVDTIINQKNKNVICVYVAVGQKASSVKSVYETLEKHGAMDYTVIVCASAADSASMQYIAPYAGCALAEYFMNKSEDVLIIYDDLSKHAVAYRSISLLLGRSPGREAYPGDVFYMHSRLLERSARLSEEKGGGSMTALPIVETKAGDVSAYIPTNIISITDGQLFLETDLFYSGQRPAVNIGLSVSRVGGDAQTKAMKQATATLRLDLAQYREMEIFTQFSSDLDDATKEQLKHGQRLMAMLRQKQCAPLSHHAKIIYLVCAKEKCMKNIQTDDVGKFLCDVVVFAEKEHNDLCERIDKSGTLTDDDRLIITEIAEKVVNGYVEY
ncbi:MAG: F0F1 ATP synthase subunit alpha [Clostridia bacterium]|nr:F0F1 ATP synthase subunit alpha [Clostridia bacterium]